MARTRLVRPEFFTSPTIAQLPDGAQLAFIGLLIHADDYGVIKDSPALLRIKTRPYDLSVTDDVMAGWIAHMIDLGLLYRAEAVPAKKGNPVTGSPPVTVLVVTNWREHQAPPKPTRQWLLVSDLLLGETGQDVEQATPKGPNFGGAYAEAFKAAHGELPPRNHIARAAKAAKSLIAEGKPEDKVMEACKNAAEFGQPTIDTAYAIVTTKGTRTGARPTRSAAKVDEVQGVIARAAARDAERERKGIEG